MPAPKLLHSQCSHCETQVTSANTCAGCKVVQYCNQEHQTSHWPQHKPLCSVVRKSRTLMDKEETKLRSHEGDFMMPANPFDQPGHFWGWMETRPYMRARYGLIDGLRKIKTREAVQAAHDHAMAIFHLNRSDNMGVRSMAPALMMRLGKDQEAYDFMKWYATTGNESDYDWGDMDLPFLDLSGENAFEPLSVGDWTEKFSDLAHVVSITLIKLRLLLDLRELEQRNPVGTKVPQEILDLIRAQLASNTVANNEAIMQDVRNGNSLEPWIRNLEEQADTLFKAVNKSNKFFWPAMVTPGTALTARPASYSMGSREEMQLMLQYSYEAWEETGGAIEWVRKKLGK